jgi:hypothetical protein
MNGTVADFTFATELLESLVDDDTPQGTTLVICSTRKAFLHQIAPTLLTPQVQEIPASQESLEEDVVSTAPLPHRFLVPTLGLLASTRALKTAFCPTVKSLRAWLSTYTASTETSLTPDNDASRNLIVVDLILLHSDTLEFSVQGLSRTLACVIEAAARNRVHPRLVECKDFHHEHDSARGYALWGAQVPLLSGSVRLGGDGVNWAGRAISVKTIASRWFRFEQKRPDVAKGTDEAEDEEMLV